MKVKLLFLYFICTILAATNCFAQTASITAKIIDAEDSNAITNATIVLLENNTTATSNANGICKFKGLQTNDYTLKVSHIGYITTKEIIQIQNNKSLTVTIRLEKRSVTYGAITVANSKDNSQNKILANEVMLRPINSSQDLLRSVPSLFIAQHAGGGKAEQIFLRGFDIDHGTDINITVDGMPVNMISHAHGQGYADLHFLIPETIEKLQFDKGPYHAEKGNLATAGYVEFKTKNFIDENSVKVEAGLFNMQRVSSQLNLFAKENNKGKQQLYVASEYFKSDGYFESPQNFKRMNAMAKYSLVQKNNTKLHVLFSKFYSKWDASGQIPERAVKDGSINSFGAIDDTEGGETSRLNASVQYTQKLGSKWELSQQAYFSNYRFNLFSNFTFFLNNPVDGDMINQQEKRNIFGYFTNAKKQGMLFGKRQVSTYGVGFRYDNVKDIFLANTPKKQLLNYVQQGSIKETNAFAFANKTINISKQFTINGSLRFDYFKFGYKNKLLAEDNFSFQQKFAASPKLNINYAASNKVNLFISNGIGFHSNDTRVILDNSVKDILPKVYGTDIGATINLSKAIQFKTIFWHLFSEQEFVYVGDAGIVEPSGASRRLGIDFSSKFQLSKWLDADMEISLAKARLVGEKNGENYIPLAPLFTSIGGFMAKVSNKLSGSLRYRFMDTRPANEDYSVSAAGYFLLDAVVNYKVKKTVFSISVENVFNQQWREAQFNTESRLFSETEPVSEIHYTPGSPFFIKAGVQINFGR
jgi:outer membrane cobalamin receptor